ncbi:DUF4956 domain-containing protein [Rubripirellula sp.]|nr:DUF4956 domain-containing protein [Rubripirellula sp.]
MDFFSELFETSAAVDVISVGRMFWSTTLAFVLSLITGYMYRVTHRGPSYSQSTVHTMVIMSVVVALIMLIIGSNIARAFSLVGALSIIRFRNAVKESRDVAFFFVAMAIGMACGTGFMSLATVFTLNISAMIYLMTRFDIGAKPMVEVLLRITVDDEVDYRNRFDASFYKHFTQSDLISVDSDGTGKLELIYSVTLRSDAEEQSLFEDLRGIDSSIRCQLIHGHGSVNV